MLFYSCRLWTWRHLSVAISSLQDQDSESSVSAANNLHLKRGGKTPIIVPALIIQPLLQICVKFVDSDAYIRRRDNYANGIFFIQTQRNREL